MDKSYAVSVKKTYQIRIGKYRVVFRMYQTRHHRLVTKMATMNSLQNSANNVPAKTQHQGNLMGDCYSSKVAKQILGSVAENNDEALLELQAGVESLWRGKMTGAPLRSRRAMAKRMGINGFTLNPDNVGIVSNNSLFTLSSLVQRA